MEDEGLFTSHLNALDPEALPISFPPELSRAEARDVAAAGPSNKEIVDACKARYHEHRRAVDKVTLGGVDTARSREMRPYIAAIHNYDWSSKVPAGVLAEPVYSSGTMAEARGAVKEDRDFATFFIGMEANADVVFGAVGGVGVGLPFPSGKISEAIWMAYGGLRIAINIDIAINLCASIFIEPPEEVAGDYLGIEVSAEPVYEGPSVGFGIHLTPDLSRLRGFTLAIGVELGVLPVNAAIVRGRIITSASSAALSEAA